MDPDTLYIIENRDGSVSYARTPDGIGCFWYDEDQYEEAKHDVSTYLRSRYFYSHDEFENFRHGPFD